MMSSVASGGGWGVLVARVPAGQGWHALRSGPAASGMDAGGGAGKWKWGECGQRPHCVSARRHDW